MPNTSANKDTASEVIAYCGSCKLDLAAMIVAKVGSKIVKVQCKTCKKERAFKPAKGITSPEEAAAFAASKPPRKSRKAADDTPAVSIEAEWTRLMHEAAKSNKVKYTQKTKLQLGDVVDHPMFGEGVVTKTTYPDKAEIIFKMDVKTLIHSR